MAGRRMLLNKNGTFVPHLIINYRYNYDNYDLVEILHDDNIKYKITGIGNIGVIEIMFKNEFILPHRYSIDFLYSIEYITVINQTDNIITLNTCCISTDSNIITCGIHGKFKFKEDCINSSSTKNMHIYGPNCIFEDNAFDKYIDNIYYYDKLQPITIIKPIYPNIYTYPHILYDLMKYNNVEEGDEEALKYKILDNTKLIISSPTSYSPRIPDVDLGNNNYIQSITQYMYNGNYITEYGCKSIITHLRKGIILPQNATVYFPDTVTDIDNDTFANESNLKKVVIFGNCKLTYLHGFFSSELKDIEIYSDKIETIKYSCFEDTLLNIINIPKSVKYIESYAFSHINGHFIINYNGTINEWSSINFQPNWMGDMQEIKVICTDGIIIETPNTPRANEIWYTSIDDNIINVDIQYTNNELLSNTYGDKGKLVFKNTIDNITSLFKDSAQLKEVWLPNYNIIENVSAFDNCTNLITVNNSKQLKKIQDGIFKNCVNLQRIEIDGYYIEPYAFDNCTSLNYVKISKRVEDIYEISFRNCTSLESINYEGTIEEWNNIDIKSGWRDGSTITTIHCSDGDIQL